MTDLVRSFSRLCQQVRSYSRKLALEREAEIKVNGLPEIPTILDLLVAGRLQDPAFANVELDDLVGIMTGMRNSADHVLAHF